ncbi:MAG TPA: riboflavin synthase [Xanthobacteraceae bacterium]|nr:riboflavin synthase [Xanthobacteraceae bacterium]
MFTGIVTDIGKVVALEPRNDVRRITIATAYETAGIALGASIACSGVCLTVVATAPGSFAVEAAPETLAVTTAAAWGVGTRLNLERALKIGDELGGHIVQGHVDGLATVIAREDLGETTRFTFEAPAALARFIAAKGSVALEGTSLTVNTVEGPRFTCLLIPHTLAETGWGDVHPGAKVNIEIDMMARYAARLAEFR